MSEAPIKTLLVPADPFMPAEPDEHFQREADVAKGLGLNVLRLDFEALLYDDQVKVYGPVDLTGGPLLYRGWMLSVKKYKTLFQGLREKGLDLITTPEYYEKAHTLP